MVEKPRLRRTEVQNLASCAAWENRDSEESQWGTLIHHCIALWYDTMQSGVADWSIEEIVRQGMHECPGVGLDRLDEAHSVMRRFVNTHTVTGQFYASEIALEIEEKEAILYGTLDLLEVLEWAGENPSAMRITDFKSGWGKTEHLFQLRFYAALVMANFPFVDTVYLRTDHFRLNDGIVDSSTATKEFDQMAYTVDRDWIMQWWSTIVRPMLPHVVRASQAEDPAPTGGSACRYCGKRSFCPAATNLARDLGSIEEEGVARYVMEAHRLSTARDALVEALKEALGEREPVLVNGLEAGYFRPKDVSSSSAGNPRFAIRPHRESRSA